jgi:hypothetical protein
MIVVICLVAFTLLMACLGFFFNIYLTWKRNVSS